MDTFCRRVSDGLEDIVDELTEKTGRGGRMEQDSWRNSLPPLAEVLEQAKRSHQPLGDVHLSLGSLALEYRLPAANA